MRDSDIGVLILYHPPSDLSAVGRLVLTPIPRLESELCADY
jgi:hypothetical protein